MVAVFLIPVYALVCGYLFFRLYLWLPTLSVPLYGTPVWWAVLAVLLCFAVSPAVALLLPAGSPAKQVAAHMGNYFMGVLLYSLLVVGAADLGRLILRLIVRDPAFFTPRLHAVTGGICLLIVAAVTVGGVINANIIRVKPYEIAVEKDCGLDHLDVMLVADLHLGYNMGDWRTRQMVELINARHPDLVLISGDIFDNDYDAMYHPDVLTELLGQIDAKYGVYAVYGNHDVAEKALSGFTFGSPEGKASDPRMDEMLEKAGIRLLRDECVTVADSVVVAGRADRDRPGRGIEVRKTPEELLAGVDRAMPILVMDHQPRELTELAAAGADVDLCGHTHDGQLFPGNLVIKFFWEIPCGCLLKDGMHTIVTSGVGLYGSNIRVATAPEICPVTIRFTGAKDRG